MWKVYSRPRKKVADPVAKASINRRAEISMNFEAWQQLGEPYIVTLWYDNEARRIAVRALDAEEREGDAFIVRPWGTSGGRVVRAQRLFTRCGIKITEKADIHRPGHHLRPDDPVPKIRRMGRQDRAPQRSDDGRGIFLVRVE